SIPGLHRALDAVQGHELDARDVAELARELTRLADVDQAGGIRMRRDPLRRELRDPAGAHLDRRPGRRRLRLAGHENAAGYATVEIGGQGHVDLLRIGELQLAHDVDELGFGAAASEPRVVLLLLADAGHRTPLVIVAGIEE